jgi:osmotically-inducible protein OsmY
VRQGSSWDQTRDDQGRFTDRNWSNDADRGYREDRGRELHWSNEDRGYRGPSSYRDDDRNYKSQYFGGTEDYPGPGRSQGFGKGRRHDYGDWSNSNFGQNASTRERQRLRDRPFGLQSGYREREHRGYDMGEYGYGSGSTDMPVRRTWDERSDESYNWGDHAGDSREGRFRGKGPKGYKRTDERIREEINERLSDDDHVDASDIVVSVDNGEVSLSGTVSDRSSKRRAEDIVEEISGVQHVENRIRVGRVTPEEPVNKEQGKKEYANGRTKVHA